MSLPSGTRLGPYEIQSAIGAGGMGEVYKARDTRLDRSVAIKVLPPDVSADPDRRARFEREAKTIAGLTHPHICTLHDVGEHDGSLFLVMELLVGETLVNRASRPVFQARLMTTTLMSSDGAPKANTSSMMASNISRARRPLTSRSFCSRRSGK